MIYKIAEKINQALVALSHGAHHVYKRYGLPRIAIAAFVGFMVVGSALNQYKWNAEAQAQAHTAPVATQQAVAKAPVQEGKQSRLTRYYKLEECNQLISEVMGFPVSDLAFLRKDFKDGKDWYQWRRVSGKDSHTDYICTSNYGDVMVMWGMFKLGEKPSYSKWYNFNLEDFGSTL